jgi:hypothetical protein
LRESARRTRSNDAPDERLVIGGLGARVGYAVCPTGCSGSTAVAGSLPFVTVVFGTD